MMIIYVLFCHHALAEITVDKEDMSLHSETLSERTQLYSNLVILCVLVEKHHVQISWSLDLPRLNIYHT